MKVAIVKFSGVSPYSQSKYYVEDVPKKPKETHKDYEIRTWMHRIHINENGRVEVPASAFSNSIKTAAKRLQLQIPGKGKSMYTKHFESGLMVVENVQLTAKEEEVKCEKLLVPSDGKRGGGSRVVKYFPRVDEWSGEFSAHIFDDIITLPVFEQVVKSAGMLVGIGRFRPENCGYYGRFAIDSIDWVDDADEAYTKTLNKKKGTKNGN